MRTHADDCNVMCNRTVFDYRRWGKCEWHLSVQQRVQTREVAGGQRQRTQPGVERQIEAEDVGIRGLGFCFAG